MKTIVKKLAIGIILLFSFTNGFAQASINLYLTEDGICYSENFHYKVTIIVYSGANCTGSQTYCYWISQNNIPLSSPELITYSNCQIAASTYIHVCVQKYDGNSQTLCSSCSECIQYHDDMDVYVEIERE